MGAPPPFRARLLSRRGCVWRTDSRDLAKEQGRAGGSAAGPGDENLQAGRRPSRNGIRVTGRGRATNGEGKQREQANGNARRAGGQPRSAPQETEQPTGDATPHEQPRGHTQREDGREHSETRKRADEATNEYAGPQGREERSAVREYPQRSSTVRFSLVCVPRGSTERVFRGRLGSPQSFELGRGAKRSRSGARRFLVSTVWPPLGSARA